MIKRLDERLGNDFDLEAQLRQDLHTPGTVSGARPEAGQATGS
jgi:hypothetical protein